MARHYSTRDFFRQMPNSLLARYFHAHGVFGDLDFAAMKETQPDELFAAWLDLPDTRHHEMDAELRDISELSCEKGFRAIIDEAAWHFANDPEAHTAFVEQLATLANHFERAMTTFLDHHDFWKGAALFYHADSLPYWRKRTHLPRVPAAVDDASLRELASSISTFFHRTEGRGKNCVVEPFRRGPLDYFFALSRGLLAAQHRMGGRGVCTKAAQPSVRGDLCLLAAGGIARPEFPRPAQSRRTVAGHVRDHHPQASRVATRPEG